MIEQLMWTDYVLMVVIIISTLMSISKGFLKEFFSLVSLGIAVFVAFRYSEAIASLINKVIGEGTLNPTMAMTGTFLLLFILLSKILGKIASMLSNNGGSGILDKLLGILFGFVRGVFVAVVIISITLFAPYTKGDTWLNTPFTTKLQPFSKTLLYYIPDNVEEMIQAQIKSLDQSAFVVQTKKLINATFNTDLEINEGKTKEEEQIQEQETKELESQQESLNERVKFERGYVPGAAVNDANVQNTGNPLFNGKGQGSVRTDSQRDILLEKRRELDKIRAAQELQNLKSE